MHILIRSTLSCTGSFQVKKVSELSSPLVDTVTQSLRLITKGTPTFNKQKHLHLDLQTYTKFISEGTSYIIRIVTLTSCSLRYLRISVPFGCMKDIKALLNAHCPSSDAMIIKDSEAGLSSRGLDPKISKALGKV